MDYTAITLAAISTLGTIVLAYFGYKEKKLNAASRQEVQTLVSSFSEKSVEGK